MVIWPIQNSFAAIDPLVTPFSFEHFDFVYECIDNQLITNSSSTEHLDMFFTRLQESGSVINPEKCRFDSLFDKFRSIEEDSR